MILFYLRMDQQLSKPERRNMDACLRRLKQELVSLKDAGDGLQSQMNSMMGALQELKLLQVQTAVERLDISGRPIERGPPQPACASPMTPPPATPPRPQADENPRDPHQNQALPEDPSPRPKPSPHSSACFTGQSRLSSGLRPHPQCSSLGSASTSTGTSTSSLESSSREGSESPGSSQRNGSDAAPGRWSSDSLGNPRPEPGPQTLALAGPQALLDLPGILRSLSQEEGPYPPDSQRFQEGVEDDDDWTSSLMSQTRNRQPLVLGDNVFADLVGNWLDLPELGQWGEGEEQERGRRRWGGEGTADSPAHPLRLSRSQEICRKFSLATNIFKKVLRGVRPDRDKLLKERPGWGGPGRSEGDLLPKRPKRPAPKTAKGSFYLPCWAAGTQRREGPQGPGLEHGPQHPSLSGGHLDRKTVDGRSERTQPLLDHHSAVWV